ncbi:hypothetical protein [Colwellia sp. MEBiC06753]
MKKFALALIATMAPSLVLAQSTIVEGVIDKADVITTHVGSNGKPLLGAAIGVGIGSAIGSGSGNDAAKILGGIIGAKTAAQQHKKLIYGWRYIVKSGDQLLVVDDWCPVPEQQCSGIPQGNDVYVINGKEVALK